MEHSDFGSAQVIDCATSCKGQTRLTHGPLMDINGSTFLLTAGLHLLQIQTRIARLWQARLPTSPSLQTRATKWIGIQNGPGAQDVLRLMPRSGNSDEKESLKLSIVVANTRIPSSPA